MQNGKKVIFGYCINILKVTILNSCNMPNSVQKVGVDASL